MSYTPPPSEFRVNISQPSSCVALEWITSVVRPPPPTAVARVTSGAQPPEQVVETLLLTVRGKPGGMEHPLGAEPVDQHEQLVRGQRDVHALAELAVLLRLDQVPAQPLGEAVELRVLQC